VRIFISTDMEGLAGVVGDEQRSRKGQDYRAARGWMAQEVNAVIEGAMEKGATEFVVNDAHASAQNLALPDLHEQAVLIGGANRPLSMMEGIQEGFDAAVFVGYHAMRGTQDACMDHTYSEAKVLELRLNGTPYGEIGINARVAGHFGVPVVLVSGDDKTAAEAKAFLGDVETVMVKKAIGRHAARSLGQAQVHRLLREAVGRALVDLSRFKPLILPGPMEMELEFVGTEQADRAQLVPGVERTGPRTVSARGSNFLELFRLFLFLLR
jgi:D-amino peptidase